MASPCQFLVDSGPSDVVPRWSPGVKDISDLKILDRGGDKFISRFPPRRSCQVRFGRTTTLKSARCSSSMDGFPSVRCAFCTTSPSSMSSSIPDTGRKASDISSWRNAQVCLSVPLSMACPSPNSTRPLVILDEMHSYTSKVLGAVTGGPYNNRNMPYPWNSPDALSSIKEYPDC